MKHTTSCTEFANAGILPALVVSSLACQPTYVPGVSNGDFVCYGIDVVCMNRHRHPHDHGPGGCLV
jgi:hypothetical protein